MKYKLMSIGLIITVIITCFGIKYFDGRKSLERVHQHRSYSEIPVMDINVDGKAIEGAPLYEVDAEGAIEWERYIHENPKSTFGTITYHDNSSNITSDMLVHVRGNSSRYFMKKSYLVHLIDKQGLDKSISYSDMGGSNEWVLNGPCLDRTLIRNYMCMNIAGEIMDYSPEVRFVKLNIDGQYQGIYILMETITREQSRLNLSKSKGSNAVTSYIVKLDRTRPDVNMVNTLTEYTLKNGALAYDLCYPGKDNVTDVKAKYVKDDMSRIEKKLYSYDLFYDKHSYRDDVDIRAFAQYFVINEFFGNMDAGYYSTYLYKDVRGKVKPCVWDFNNACDNYMDQANDYVGFDMQYAPWFERLVEDERFTDEVIYQYRQLRKTVLSDEYLQNYITETIAFLGDEVDANYAVWGDVWDYSDKNWYEQATNYLSPFERNVTSYDDAVKQLRTYITNRGNWLDLHIEDIKQYSHPSRTANDRTT